MELREVILGRRSVRSYTNKPVSEEDILKLIDMARWAPHSSESWKFVVVREQKKKEELAKAAQQDFIAAAPVIIVVGADVEAFTSKGEEVWYRWDAYKFRGIFYIQETAAAIQNLMLAATELGLGTCWIGSFNEGDVARAVGFSANIRPMALIPVGYPLKEKKKTTRKSLDKILSWEKYN